MRKKRLLYAIICSMMVACSDEMYDRNSVYTGNEIRFATPEQLHVSSRGTDEKMGCANNDTLISIIGIDSLFLSVRKNPIQQYMATTRSANVEDEIKEFHVDAFYIDKNGINMEMEETIVSVKDGCCSYNPVNYWPHEQALDFLAWTATKPDTVFQIEAPKLNIITNEEEKRSIATFDYYLQEDERNIAAEGQADIMFAVLKGERRKDSAVQFTFKHVLSAITFKVGSMPENTRINNITIENVKGAGTCTININDNANYGWTSIGENMSFSQDMGQKEAEESGNLLNDRKRTFMMIPQQLTEDANIIIEFTVAQHDYIFEAPINIFTPEWESGYEYTYSVSLREFFEVGISSESVDDASVKKSVKIQNTGLKTSHIRVLINGYWQDSNLDEFGNKIIIMPWDINDNLTGIVNWGADWSQYWMKREENKQEFYYYKFPVGPGEYTAVPFFEEYRITANPPTVDSSLEMNIIVQSVPADIAGQSWNITLTEN